MSSHAIGKQILAPGVMSVLMGLCGCGFIGSPCTPADELTDCPLNAFCKVDEGNCDNNLAVGICTAIPDACTLEYAPVCGCDGVTYGNECAADGAGVNIDYAGECGDLCGGLQGLACDDGEFCNYTDGSCGAADQTGVCQEIPDACPELFAPVCGCDDQTYDNECFANAASVSVLHEGPCEGEGQACGGDLDFTCNEGDFCKYATGVCGTDEGVCTPIPSECTGEFNPVCGCDNVTYVNECLANAEGVSVAGAGACTQ